MQQGENQTSKQIFIDCRFWLWYDGIVRAVGGLPIFVFLGWEGFAVEHTKEALLEAKRRIQAFTIAAELIDRETGKGE